jgi:hypothetical protein
MLRNMSIFPLSAEAITAAYQATYMIFDLVLQGVPAAFRLVAIDVYARGNTWTSTGSRLEGDREEVSRTPVTMSVTRGVTTSPLSTHVVRHQCHMVSSEGEFGLRPVKNFSPRTLICEGMHQPCFSPRCRAIHASDTLFGTCLGSSRH